MVSRAGAALVVGAMLALSACADDDEDTATTTTPTTAAPAEVTTTSAPPETTSTTAPDVGDPIEAAEDFLVTFLPGTTPTLGEFQQGDSQSGEVEVFRPREGGGVGPLASTLLLRIVDGQWQVIAAVNPNVTIDSPENGSEVDPGPLTVLGVGRGFEATLVATVADLDGNVVAQEVGSGGALETPEPYEIQVDLTGVAPGTELVLVVAGGSGLDRDTGEFSAVRITT